MNISVHLCKYLVSTLDGFGFEHLIQQLLAIRDGDQFVSLGGVHDGGADGFLRHILEERAKPTSFVQISTQEDAAAKIRQTAKRLQEFGRQVLTIFYWTNQKLDVDVLEEKLSNELNIVVRIRDWDAVIRLINTNDATRTAFNHQFSGEILELTAVRQVASEQDFDVVSDPSVYVFLQYERTERFSKGGLVAPIVDSLIYWSLRETDPETGNLLSRQGVKIKISEVLPEARNTILPSVDERLKYLCTKTGGGEQRVRHYRNSDSFCLPYDVRLEIADKSAKELLIQSEMLASLESRATKLGSNEPKLVSTICQNALYRHFHEQGLILSAFLERRLDSIVVSDQIVERELQAAAAAGSKLSKNSYAIALLVLQGVLYTPSEIENDFLHRLSKTSLLLFSLKHCPKLIEYFNKMTGKFRLLVGSDILVKAISEAFLPQEHRHITNLLKVAKACGATLLLAKPIANEVFTHLHATHLEFKNYYAEQEPYITAPMASQSDRILIRTYFYAKLLMRRVTGWKSFIEMFLEYPDLANKSDRGQQQLQAYLCKTYDLDPISEESLLRNVKPEELDRLSTALEMRNSKNSILAKNDATMVLSVYGQRTTNEEHNKYDGFGLKTWWLTKETHVLQHTGEVVQRHGGTPYIMRPEFLLNFLSLAPASAKVDSVVRDLLPSHVGLQIGQHLKSEQMHKLLGHVDQWKDLPDARRQIRVSEAIDQLKYDRLKRYESSVDLAGVDEADAVVAALNAQG